MLHDSALYKFMIDIDIDIDIETMSNTNCACMTQRFKVWLQGGAKTGPPYLIANILKIP